MEIPTINVFCILCFVICTLSQSLCDSDQKLEEPLFLTNLIDRGEIDLAREQARVRHPDITNITSYAGFFTIDKRYNSNTFFWYFPSQTKPNEAPLLLWMIGGMGLTSLKALFNYHGPIHITENQTLNFREYGYTTNHSVIYIDNPIGAGYSFTDDPRGYPTSQADIGQHVLSFVTQFFKLFPELEKNKLYLGGDSYAGKYVVSVARAIKRYNIDQEPKVNLIGVTIGNGFIDGKYQNMRADFLYETGFLDENGRDRIKTLEKQVLESENMTKAILNAQYFNKLYPDSSCNSQPSETWPATSEIIGFDYQSNFLLTKRPKPSNYFTTWVQTPDVRRALHVGNCTFNETSPITAKYLEHDGSLSEKSSLEEVLESYQVLAYNGQMDLTFPYTSTVNLYKDLKWSGAEEYKNAPRKLWKVGDDLAGYWKTAKNFNEVLIRNAGHVANFEQLLWACDMLMRFTHQ